MRRDDTLGEEVVRDCRDLGVRVGGKSVERKIGWADAKDAVNTLEALRGRGDANGLLRDRKTTTERDSIREFVSAELARSICDLLHVPY